MIRDKFKNMFPKFYDFQRNFIGATAEHTETLLMAANQVGKTFTGTWLDAAHALGDYPEGYNGHKFKHAPIIWCLGVTGEKARDLLQTPLFGHLNDGEFSGGLIRPDRILDYIPSGTSRLANTVFVKHASGSVAQVKFFSYSQGQHVLMGDVVDWAHIDEEPKDQTIRPQVITRLTNGDKGRGGRMILTFTPENGRTDLVINFMDNPSKHQCMIRAGWADAPHMTPEKIEKGLALIPPHQRDMRTKGVPMLGHGRIYDLGEEFISCDPFPIPEHFMVIGGMDFGWDHPQAQVQLAFDPETDDHYLVRTWKQSKTLPELAHAAVKDWQKDCPIAWPHDGLNTEKGSGLQQKAGYEKAGFNMLDAQVSWPEGGNSVEPGIYQIYSLMQKGKFKVFRGCRDFFDEFQMYHRDDKGKIVKTHDDVLDAVRYAFMMKRFAVRYGELGIEKTSNNSSNIVFARG
ncbi:MAG: terminase family protein [Pseudomonadota bacterium]